MFMAINKANWDIIKNKLWKEIKLFKSNKTASVVSGLNVTSHCLAQLVSSCRSWLIIPAMSAICAAE